MPTSVFIPFFVKYQPLRSRAKVKIEESLYDIAIDYNTCYLYPPPSLQRACLRVVDHLSTTRWEQYIAFSHGMAMKLAGECKSDLANHSRIGAYIFFLLTLNTIRLGKRKSRQNCWGNSCSVIRPRAPGQWLHFFS